MLALFSESSIVVAEEDGRIVGFAGNKGNYLAWLFVDPARRRQGVASQLVRAVVAGLSGEITLNVAYDNDAARADSSVERRRFLEIWRASASE
ncbi:MAG TPA: GNAT family N-acetyltransferase [Thermoanaerobaculia bacterium]|nr:GNAT family N-acetyltransferase [Thermoanaerobaculia bacterium]